MLQAAVREFADRELALRARELDEKEEFSWENWKGMADLGLTASGSILPMAAAAAAPGKLSSPRKRSPGGTGRPA